MSACCVKHGSRLYFSGKNGGLVLQMALTALVTSLNPAINPRQNTGTDSAEVRMSLTQRSTQNSA